MNMGDPLFNALPRPKPMSLAGKRVLVLGLGDTGLSVAKWVQHQNGEVRVADSRQAAPREEALIAAVPDAELSNGPFEIALLRGIDLLCVSPGISLSEPVVREASVRGIPVVGDIELFAWYVRGETQSTVIGITGTNGKSTVTALTRRLFHAAGIDSVEAGNIGFPALDALLEYKGSEPSVWVLELSSYQLETTWSLEPDTAVMLNVSEDHLDRYASLDDYVAAKARIFLGVGTQVLNRDDRHSLSMSISSRRKITFGLANPPNSDDLGILEIKGEKWLSQGNETLVRVEDLPIHGWHNAANALAALALARSFGTPCAPLIEGMRTFKGLPHRLERVATHRGVTYYDDSKGTNVGATVAALRGLGQKAILIAGGEGKGQHFEPLGEAVREFARHVLLIGRDAPVVAAALRQTGVPLEFPRTLPDAVLRAAQLAEAGDAVLLSPACASFDMFRDYRHRGEVFRAAVEKLPHADTH